MNKLLKKSMAMSLCIAMLLSVFCVSAEAKPLKDYKVHNSGWLGFGGTWDYQKNDDGEDTISIVGINSIYGQKVPKVIDNHYVTQFRGEINDGSATGWWLAEIFGKAIILALIHRFVYGDDPFDLSELGSNLTYINNCYSGVTGINFENVIYISDLLLKNGESFNFDLRKARYIGYLGRGYRNSDKFATPHVLRLPEVKCDVQERAFQERSEFILPEGVSNIDLSHFSDIKNEIFAGCSGLKGKLVLPAECKEISRRAFFGCNKINEKLVIPAKCKNIGESAFEGCSNISGLDMSNCEEVGNRAFYDCSGIKENLIIPSKCKKIGQQAFRGCSGITGIENMSSRVEISNMAFFYCEGILGNINLSQITSIGASAFEGCKKIKSVDLSSAANLPDYAFKNCYALKEVKLNSNIKNIGKETFKDCYSLSLAKNETLDLSDCDIGDRAFENCTNLEGTVLLSKDRTVSKDAFKGCDNLTIQYVD